MEVIKERDLVGRGFVWRVLVSDQELCHFGLTSGEMEQLAYPQNNTFSDVVYDLEIVHRHWCDHQCPCS